MRIPIKVKKFKPGSGQTYVKPVKQKMVYRMEEGAIDVRYWHRWPSYDFIFGVPDVGHALIEKEAAFFQYRDTRKRKIVCGFYVDMAELEVLARGFSDLLRVAKERAGSEIIVHKRTGAVSKRIPVGVANAVR